MDGRPGDDGPSAPGGDRGSRLDSWKEIAAYLNRDLRTLQRWEKTGGLPIRRLNKPGMRAVFAYTADLDAWLQQQSPEAAAPERDESDPAAALAALAPVVAKPRVTARRVLLAAGVLLAAIAGVVAVVSRRNPPPFGALTARPITADPGSERDPDISPDGLYVTYSAVAPDLSARVQVRLIAGGEPRALSATTTNEWSPVWSPDGARIALLRGDSMDAATVFTVSALGGDERKIADVRPRPPIRTNLVGHFLAWMPDGRHLVTADHTDADAGRLFLIDLSNGARTALTTPGRAEFDVEPSVSSDGRLLVFNRVRGDYLSDVFVQSLGPGYAPQGPARKLPSSAPWNGSPRLLESRGEVLTCAGNLPRFSLWRQPLDGSALPVSLGIIGDNATQSAVHRASGRIVSRTFRTQSNVMRFALPASPVATAQAPPVQPFLESTFIDRSATYSGDGSRIAFISDRTGSRQLWVATAAGENSTEWRQPFEAGLEQPSWSPDQSKVAFSGADPGGRSQLFVADAATRVARPVTQDALDYGHVVWSPDGQFLYAAAIEQSKQGIYRVPAEGGKAELVQADYDSIRGVAPTGAGVYVTKSGGRGISNLYYVPLPGGEPTHLAPMNFNDDAWVTRDGVYYLASRASRPLAPVALYFRTHGGDVTLLQEYTRAPGRGLSVSADGRFAVTTDVVPPISDLLLLEPAR